MNISSECLKDMMTTIEKELNFLKNLEETVLDSFMNEPFFTHNVSIETGDKYRILFNKHFRDLSTIHIRAENLSKLVFLFTCSNGKVKSLTSAILNQCVRIRDSLATIIHHVELKRQYLEHYVNFFSDFMYDFRYYSLSNEERTHKSYINPNPRKFYLENGVPLVTDKYIEHKMDSKHPL